jgi:hypothetical protein
MNGADPLQPQLPSRRDTSLYRGESTNSAHLRVELNALSAAQLIDLIERAAAANGVAKTIPGDHDLAAAYRHMKRLTVVNKLIEAMSLDDIAAPDLAVLRRLIGDGFEDDASQPWVDVLRALVEAEEVEEQTAATEGDTDKDAP